MWAWRDETGFGGDHAFIGRAPGGAWENLDETFEEVFFDWLAAEDAPKRLCLLSGQPATATSREATRDGHNAAMFDLRGGY